MAGTINLSLSQQFDEHGSPLSGGLLYIYQAGTTSTPQSGYQDSPLPNPITLDAAGRIPAFFLADGSIKVRLTDSAGVTQLVADGLMVIGPSSGEGSGGSVDATTVFATGDVKVRYSVGTLSGWVRLNGRTIGSSTSGATERANADTQALFEYLWGLDSSSVVGGAGASANADWTANKALTLPDFRGRVMAGMDDMGNTAAGRLTSAGAVTGTTLGYGGGSQFHTLTTGQMPQHAHGATTSNGQSTFTLGINGSQTTIDRTSVTSQQVDPGPLAVFVASGDIQTPSVTIPAVSLNLSTTINNAGSNEAHNNVQPTIVVTMYIKL